MPLDIQIGSLGAEKFNFEINKNTHWKNYFFSRLSAEAFIRKLDFGSAELLGQLATPRCSLRSSPHLYPPAESAHLENVPVFVCCVL